MIQEIKQREVSLTPEKYEGTTLGLKASDYREKAGVLGVLKGGVQEVRYWVSFCLTSLKMLVTGQAGIQDMSGPALLHRRINQGHDSHRPRRWSRAGATELSTSS